LIKTEPNRKWSPLARGSVCWSMKLGPIEKDFRKMLVKN
jgi:hypothetical protein